MISLFWFLPLDAGVGRKTVDEVGVVVVVATTEDPGVAANGVAAMLLLLVICCCRVVGAGDSKFRIERSGVRTVGVVVVVVVDVFVAEPGVNKDFVAELFDDFFLLGVW